MEEFDLANSEPKSLFGWLDPLAPGQLVLRLEFEGAGGLPDCLTLAIPPEAAGPLAEALARYAAEHLGSSR